MAQENAEGGKWGRMLLDRGAKNRCTAVCQIDQIEESSLQFPRQTVCTFDMGTSTCNLH